MIVNFKENKVNYAVEEFWNFTERLIDDDRVSPADIVQLINVARDFFKMLEDSDDVKRYGVNNDQT